MRYEVSKQEASGVDTGHASFQQHAIFKGLSSPRRPLPTDHSRRSLWRACNARERYLS